MHIPTCANMCLCPATNLFVKKTALFQVLPKSQHNSIDLSKVRLVNRDVDAEPYTCEKLERVPKGYKFLSDPGMVAIKFQSESYF